MNCFLHQTFSTWTDSKSARLNQRLRAAIFVLSISFLISAALLTAGSAKAQTQNNAEIFTISFHDFFQRPVSSEGLLLKEQILQAQGRQVRLTGYMVQQEKIAPGQFLLAQRPVLISQHADGEADDLPPATVLVELACEQQNQFVAYKRGLIDVVGELDVGRKEDNDGRVSWVRLRMPSDGTREMNGFEFLTLQRDLQHKH